VSENETEGDGVAGHPPANLEGQVIVTTGVSVVGSPREGRPRHRSIVRTRDVSTVGRVFRN